MGSSNFWSFLLLLLNLAFELVSASPALILSTYTQVALFSHAVKSLTIKLNFFSSCFLIVPTVHLEFITYFSCHYISYTHQIHTTVQCRPTFIVYIATPCHPADHNITVQYLCFASFSFHTIDFQNHL